MSQMRKSDDPKMDVDTAVQSEKPKEYRSVIHQAADGYPSLYSNSYINIPHNLYLEKLTELWLNRLDK